VYVQAPHPSGISALAWRLRTNRKPAPVTAPPLPALLRKDAVRALRHRAGETPRRFFFPSYAASCFREAARALVEARAATTIPLVIAYSIKTNPLPDLLDLVRDAGMWAEAISQHEATHALSRGFPSEHIVLNGPAKWWPSPVKVPRFGAVFCDSIEELRLVRQREFREQARADYLGVRLRPATVASRFGISIHRPEVFREVVRALKGLPRNQGIGFHFHVASSLVGVRTWHYLADHFIVAAALLMDRIGPRPLTVSFGGGWHPDEWTLFIRDHLRPLLGRCRHELPTLRRVILEPGKALAQPSMGLVVRVLEVRPRSGYTEIVADGSVAELPDARSHPHRILSLAPSGKPQVWGHGGDRILGRLCMEFDVLADAVRLPRGLKAGDCLAILDAGAYDASMAYTFGRGSGC
jgi:diaminopimelate decarboxylase